MIVKDDTSCSTKLHQDEDTPEDHYRAALIREALDEGAHFSGLGRIAEGKGTRPGAATYIEEAVI